MGGKAEDSLSLYGMLADRRRCVHCGDPTLVPLTESYLSSTLQTVRQWTRPSWSCTGRCNIKTTSISLSWCWPTNKTCLGPSQGGRWSTRWEFDNLGVRLLVWSLAVQSLAMDFMLGLSNFTS